MRILKSHPLLKIITHIVLLLLPVIIYAILLSKVGSFIHLIFINFDDFISLLLALKHSLFDYQILNDGNIDNNIDTIINTMDEGNTSPHPANSPENSSSPQREPSPTEGSNQEPSGYESDISSDSAPSVEYDRNGYPIPDDNTSDYTQDPLQSLRDLLSQERLYKRKLIKYLAKLEDLPERDRIPKVIKKEDYYRKLLIESTAKINKIKDEINRR